MQVKFAQGTWDFRVVELCPLGRGEGRWTEREDWKGALGLGKCAQQVGLPEESPPALDPRVLRTSSHVSRKQQVWVAVRPTARPPRVLMLRTSEESLSWKAEGCSRATLFRRNPFGEPCLRNPWCLQKASDESRMASCICTVMSRIVRSDGRFVGQAGLFLTTLQPCLASSHGYLRMVGRFHFGSRSGLKPFLLQGPGSCRLRALISAASSTQRLLVAGMSAFTLDRRSNCRRDRCRLCSSTASGRARVWG